MTTARHDHRSLPIRSLANELLMASPTQHADTMLQVYLACMQGRWADAVALLRAVVKASPIDRWSNRVDNFASELSLRAKDAEHGPVIMSDDFTPPDVARFVGMVDVDGEQFAHFSNVNLG